MTAPQGRGRVLVRVFRARGVVQAPAAAGHQPGGVGDRRRRHLLGDDRAQHLRVGRGHLLQDEAGRSTRRAECPHLACQNYESELGTSSIFKFFY